MKIAIVSGYFNPLHVGHLDYMEAAKELADKLIVIVNSDYQRKIKGSKEFMMEDERVFIINQLKIVDKSFISIDRDRSVCETIKLIHNEYSLKYDLCFANGGDQTNDSIPEISICKKLNIRLIDKLGSKIQSSSWLLK